MDEGVGIFWFIFFILPSTVLVVPLTGWIHMEFNRQGSQEMQFSKKGQRLDLNTSGHTVDTLRHSFTKARDISPCKLLDPGMEVSAPWLQKQSARRYICLPGGRYFQQVIRESHNHTGSRSKWGCPIVRAEPSVGEEGRVLKLSFEPQIRFCLIWPHPCLSQLHVLRSLFLSLS